MGMKKRNVLAVLFLSIFLFACSRQPQSLYAPDFTLPDLDGKKVSLSDYRGKLVIIDFFSTTCPVCVELIPNLREVYKKFKDHDLVILGIDLDAVPNEQALKEFVRRKRINYPVLIGNEDIVLKYGGFSVLPYMVFIDKEGKIFKTHQGYIEKKELEVYILKMMERREDGF